jgi:hypothetical protein
MMRTTIDGLTKAKLLGAPVPILKTAHRKGAQSVPQGRMEKTMKYLVAGLGLIFAMGSANAFAITPSDQSAFNLCKAFVLTTYGSDARVTLHKIKRNTIELYVIKDGKTKVSCDKATYALTEV